MKEEFTFAVTALGEGFWCLEQRGVRCFLLAGSERAILVDCCHGGDLAAECRKLTDQPITLVLTHADPDHIGCISQFDTVYASPSEYTTLSARIGSLAKIRPLWEGERIENGRFSLQAVLIPGHTPGSLALLEAEKRFLLGGDSVQTGPIYMFGAHRNIDAYRASMRKLQTMQPQFDVVYSSHHELCVSPEIIGELAAFADEISSGLYPPAEPAPDRLPATVKTYRKGNAQFFLEKP